MHIASADVRQKTEGVVERRMKRRESVKTQESTGGVVTRNVKADERAEAPIRWPSRSPECSPSFTALSIAIRCTSSRPSSAMTPTLSKIVIANNNAYSTSCPQGL